MSETIGDREPDEVTAELLARYAAGAMSDAERTAFEGRLLREDALAETLYADQSVVAAVRAARAKRARRTWPRALPIAAAVAAIVGFVAFQDRLLPRRATLRGGEGADAVRLLEPAGDLAAVPSRFVWTRSSQASAYRVRVYDDALRLAGEAVTRDTILLRENIPGLDRLGAGSWSVTPLDSSGLELPPSPITEFRLRP